MSHGRSRSIASTALLAAALVAPAAAAQPAAAAAATPRVMEFSSSLAGWSSTSTRVDATALQHPAALSIIGTTVLFGTDANGHLVLSSPDATGSGAWSSTDLSAASRVPSLRGSPAVVVDRAQRIVVFGRSVDDHLIRLRAAAGAGSWAVTDMTAELGAPPIASTPSAAIGARGGIGAFYRTPEGHLVGMLQVRRLANRWEQRDLTRTTSSPLVSGAPSAVSMRLGGANLGVAARASDGRMLLFADDNEHLTMWTSYDISAASSAGPIASSPTAAVLDGRVALSAVRGDGSLVVASAPRAASQRWTAADLTSATSTAALHRDQPSVASDGVHLIAAVRSADRHLLVLSADAASGFHAASATDVTDSAGGISITSAPVISARAGGVAAYASRYLPPPPPPPPPPPSDLAKTIVAIAKGQDQTAAKVAEVPMGTNCNPYTGHFGRGNRSGCPAGSSAEAWCSDFANWVWQQAGAQIGGLTGWSYTFVSYGRAHGTFKAGATNSPQPGDAVVFGDESRQYGSHVGIVVAVRDGKIKMTSGNWGDAVITTDFFDPSGDSGAGYPIIGYSSPVAVGAAGPHALRLQAPAVSQEMIDSQDQGR